MAPGSSQLALRSLEMIDRIVPFSVTSRIEKGIVQLQGVVSRAISVVDPGRVQAEQRIAELEGFIKSLPDIVYELRLFREDISEEEKREVLSLVREIQKSSEDKLDEIVEKLCERLAGYVDGTILYSNLKAEQTLGISLDRVGDITMAELIAKKHLAIALKNAFKILSQKVQEGLEYDIIAADGRRIPVSINAKLISEQFPFIIRGVARDFTEYKRAESALRASEERMKATLNALPDLLFEIDAKGRIYGFHSSDTEKLYKRPEDFLGKKIIELFPKETAAILMGAIEEAVEKGEHRGARYSLQINGSVHWFELSIATANGSEILKDRLVVLVRDVTEQVRTQKEIEEHKVNNAKLRIVNRLFKTIADYLGQILPGIGGSREFASTNISSLESKIAILRTEGSLSEETFDILQSIINDSKKLLSDIGDSSDRLYRFAENIRIFASDIKLSNPEFTDVNLLLEESIEKISDRKIKINFDKTDGLPKVQMSLSLIESAILLFFEDAVNADYSDGEGLVNVYVEREKEGVKIVIADNGKRDQDISMAILKTPIAHGKTPLYEKYLGLSIALKYIEAHGGKCQIISNRNTGTEFTIWLPVRIPQKNSGKRAENERKIKKILVVDDDPGVRGLIKRMLEMKGFQVMVTESAEEALDLLEEEKDFDLIFTDLVMGGMDGSELIDRIREKDDEILVFCMSGYSLDPDIQQRIDETLDKPFGSEKVYSLIGKYNEPDSDDS